MLFRCGPYIVRISDVIIQEVEIHLSQWSSCEKINFY